MKTLFICALALLVALSIPVLAVPIGILLIGYAVLVFLQHSDD
jgi:hypothetical protein